MLITVIGMCVVSAAAIVFVRKYSPENALMVSLASGCVILTVILINSSETLAEIGEIFTSFGLETGVIKAVFKAMGVCYVTLFAVNVCRDNGQTSLASKIELAGKISVAVLALPLIKEILKAAVELF